MDERLQKIAKTWNDYTPTFDKEHDTEDLELWKQTLIYLMGENRKKILDVGTGTGFLAILCAQLGHKSYGVDIANDMMKLGMEHAREKGVVVSFQHAMAEELPFAENSFDVVMNSRLLWTLLEPDKALRDWHRVLKPRGRLLSFIRLAIESPEQANWCYGEEFEKQLPFKFATEEDYKHVYKRAGFVNVEIIDLPEVLSVAPLNPWKCVYGEKEDE